jgi:hypothetical protein
LIFRAVWLVIISQVALGIIMSNEKTIANAADVAVAATVGAVWLAWLPSAAAILTIIYTAWRLIASLDYRRQRQQFPFAKFGSPGIEAKHPPKDGEET